MLARLRHGPGELGQPVGIGPDETGFQQAR